MLSRAASQTLPLLLRRARVQRTFAALTLAPSVTLPHRWCSSIAARTDDLVVHIDHTPNPDCIKFSPESLSNQDISLMPPGAILDISSAARAEQSPLATRIFKIEGVTSVCIADYWLTVTKSEEVEWEELNPRVTEAVKAWVAAGEKVTAAEYVEDQDTEIDPSFDTEVVQAIKELVKTRIRPWVQQDGGNIKFIGFEDGVVLLLMQGACQSCPSSGATLKGGIEKMMMHWIPEVLEVRPVDEDFAEEYVAEVEETRKLYKLGSDGKLVRRDGGDSDEDLLNKGI